MSDFNIPEDVDDAFWADVEKAIAIGSPEQQVMLSLLGEHGKHVFGAGFWLSGKLLDMGLSDEAMQPLTFIAGRLMTMYDDPWDVAVKMAEECQTTAEELSLESSDSPAE